MGTKKRALLFSRRRKPPAKQKKRGSAAFNKYRQYKHATTLRTERQLGATPTDLHADRQHGYLKIVDQQAAAPSHKKARHTAAAGQWYSTG